MIVCILMLVSIVSSVLAASQHQQTQTNDFRTVRRGFFIGYFVTITWEGDSCILSMNDGNPPYPYPVTFVVPFRFRQLGAFEQIQLINPKYCIIKDHFIIGFSMMAFPKSTVSMHVISQEDEHNMVTWVIDSIDGDAIWGSNIHAHLFLPDGSRYIGGTRTYPYPMTPAYMKSGDEFKVIVNDDGIYQLKIFDMITGRVLYTSSFIHF
jgi:hypothetical protein